MAYNNSDFDAIPVPDIVVEPLSGSIDNLEAKNRSGNIFIIGNFPTITKLSKAYNTYNSDVLSDLNFDQGYTVENGDYASFPVEVPFHCDKKNTSDVWVYKDLFSLLFKEHTNENNEVISKGAENVVFVNTSEIDDINRTITSRELTPSVLKETLKLINNSLFDILYIAESLEDVVIEDHRTTLEVAKEFVDIQYNRKNPFGIVASLEYEDFTGITTPSKDFNPTNMKGLINVAHKIGTPGYPAAESTPDNTSILNTKYNGGFYGIALQSIHKDIGDIQYIADKREVAAEIANMLAGRNVDEALTQTVYPVFTKIDPLYDLDLGIPSDNTSFTDGQGYTLSGYGYSIFTTGNIVNKEIIQVQSLVPRQQQENNISPFQQYNVSHHYIRNNIISNMDLRNFLGKKRIISVLDDLNFDVEKTLSDAETDELILSYTDYIVPNKIYSDVVDIKIELVLANFIGEIRLEVITSIAGAGQV